MIAISILQERQRLALLRGGRFRRFLGPGIVVSLSLPGTTRHLISVGDRGRLLSTRQARFGEVPLPITLRSAAPAGDVRVAGFRADALVVEAAVAPAGTQPAAQLPQQATVKPKLTARNFWIGLPVVVFFCAVTWGGLLYSANEILVEQQLYGSGELTNGTVSEKRSFARSGSSSSNLYYVRYQFQTPDAGVFDNDVRIEYTLWSRFREGEKIAVRYLPKQPEVNLPDGRHLEQFFYITGALTFVGALLFSAILIGMLLTKFKGGYSAHPSRRS